jgi:hypothetical protein
MDIYIILLCVFLTMDYSMTHIVDVFIVDLLYAVALKEVLDIYLDMYLLSLAKYICLHLVKHISPNLSYFVFGKIFLWC